MQGRFLPDKAIDLVDEACANKRVQLESVPEEIDNMLRHKYRLQVPPASSMGWPHARPACVDSCVKGWPQQCYYLCCT